MLVFFGFFTFLLGAFLSCYFQIYYSLGKVYYYWALLVKYARKEREFFLILLPKNSEDYQIIVHQQHWLKKVSNINKKHFRSSGEELVSFFISIEEKLNEIAQKIFQNDQLLEFSIEERQDVISALESFWATKNLFEFQLHNYNNVSQRYFLIQKKKTCSWLFILLRYPSIPLDFPSFY